MIKVKEKEKKSDFRNYQKKNLIYFRVTKEMEFRNMQEKLEKVASKIGYDKDRITLSIS